jgi:signal transduction histidine kinase
MQQASLARVGQLAAVVAHEVKNPLAGVKGAVQVLMSRRAPADPEVQVMRDIVGRIDALNELIGDLLVFARPRAPRLQPVELRPLLEEAVSALRRDPVAATLPVEVEGPNLVIDADAELIRATVLNLLINAAQALEGTGRITVSVSQQGADAVLEVRDTGPGIPPDLREQVFEPFVTTKARGGGLGLPIARRVAELHGGALTLASPPGPGTVMRLTLPLRQQAPPRSGAAPPEVGPHVERARLAQE